jgi:Na+/proline symporter
MSGISFYMNSFSALAFVMYSALAYKYGWVPVTVSWLSVPAVLLGAWFLAVRWRRAASASPIDYIATRYTPAMCRTLAVLGLPMQLLDNALKLLAIGTVVGVGMGFPLFWSICISGLIIVLYTFLGGLKATLACDFIQFFVILAVVFSLPPLCLERLAALDGASGMAAGFKAFVDRAPEGFFDFTAGKYTWVYMLVFFLCVGSTLSTNWSLVQRYYSTKSEKDARKMAYLVAALLFLGPPLFFFPAMAARVFMPPIPEAEINGTYALVCKAVLPAGMIGMVIAAMFSATMSSLAGNFNAAAAVMVNELYLKIDRTASAARRIVAARVATVLVGAAVVALTFVMQYAQGADDLFNLSNKVFGVFLPPIAIPMLAGLFVRRLSKRSALVALVGGIAVGLAMFALGSKSEFQHLREMVWIFPATAFATVVFLAVGSRLFPDSADERAEVEKWMDGLTCR